MPKIVKVLVIIAAMNAFAAGCWAGYRAQRRADEIAVVDGSFKITAEGMFNTTVNVYDRNDIANATFDFEIIEGHHDALRALGFTSVHVQTATGQTLDKPL